MTLNIFKRLLEIFIVPIISKFSKKIRCYIFLENFVFILKNFRIFAIYEKNEKYPGDCCNMLIPCELQWL